MDTRRRTVLAAGAAGAAALAVGCGQYGDEGGGTTTSEPPASPTPDGTQAPSGDATTGAAPAGRQLATTSEIPVGGGKVFADEKTVVVQPTSGDFKAYSSVCTHQGCNVTTVADGTIDCPCHGSKFKVADGSVAEGPATRPLPSRQISVDGNAILLA
ncbi:Rieske (2Fe-2S) protein [Streptomyces sp. NPDC051907]|uniref:Rieske (2Fe-2S) protein n=1 Tax=Streptomyces sp. NPDC051907 TaxID=3155284 RepID=UPI0034358D44